MGSYYYKAKDLRYVSGVVEADNLEAAQIKAIEAVDNTEYFEVSYSDPELIDVYELKDA